MGGGRGGMVMLGVGGECCMLCGLLINFIGFVPLVELMYLVFTCMPVESYRRRLRSLLLCLYDVFRALINSLAC